MSKPIKIVKPFFKVNFEDLQLAKDFFENDKHYIEWLFYISEYYQGNILIPKTKIVAKYFNNYKKTMDFIIESKIKGLEGAILKAEKQQVNNDTLEGVVEGGFKEPLQLIINNKTLTNNNKEETIKNAQTLLTVNFLKWFNEMKFKHKGIKGNFKTLTKTDLNNLKELKKANYTPEDFEHAYKIMIDSEWVKINKIDTPTHFLVNTNFSKYVNTVVTEQSKFNPYG